MSKQLQIIPRIEDAQASECPHVRCQARAVATLTAMLNMQIKAELAHGMPSNEVLANVLSAAINTVVNVAVGYSGGEQEYLIENLKFVAERTTAHLNYAELMHLPARGQA